jgi:hypothetical protein
MFERLSKFIVKLKSNSKVTTFDEARTKQAIILPLLQFLDWDTADIDEVTPEYSVENKRVDYSLRLNNTNEFFIEVKKTGEELEKYQEQLLDYSFRQGVELATLTNGITWWFYLPTKKGNWRDRKFYTIDILQQDLDDVVSKFIDLLSKHSVQTGKAVKHAESIYEGRKKKKVVEETLPEAWNKIISEPDAMLVDLIADVTERLCGFKPDRNDVKQFLAFHEAHFLISPESSDEFIVQNGIPPKFQMNRRLHRMNLYHILSRCCVNMVERHEKMRLRKKSSICFVKFLSGRGIKKMYLTEFQDGNII